MDCIGTTIEGLEEGTLKETSGKLYAKGRVIFKDFKKTYFTLDKIYKLIKKYEFSSLKDLKNKIKKTKIELKGTFSCSCTRKGNHKFNSVIAEQEIGKILKTKGLSYKQKAPTNTIIIDIVQNTCILGILIKKDLAKREYRLKLHKQTTPPLLASSLIRILNIKTADSLLVLEAKDGIIPIEASLQGIKKILAQDNEKNNTRNAEINARLAKAHITFTNKKIKDLKEKKDYIITQIIFSKKRRKHPIIIQETLSIANKLLKKKLAIITNHPEDIIKYQTNKPKLEKRIKTKIGKSEVYILIYKKN